MQSKYGVLFNETCIKESLLPKYTDVRTTDHGIRFEECTLQYHRRILEVNLEKSKNELGDDEREAPILERDLKENTPERELCEAQLARLREI